MTAMLQGTLLSMAVYFEYISPTKADDKLNPDGVAGEGYSSPSSSETDQLADPTEDTPLLHDSRSETRQAVNGTT